MGGSGGSKWVEKVVKTMILRSAPESPSATHGQIKVTISGGSKKGPSPLEKEPHTLGEWTASFSLWNVGDGSLAQQPPGPHGQTGWPVQAQGVRWSFSWCWVKEIRANQNPLFVAIKATKRIPAKSFFKGFMDKKPNPNRTTDSFGFPKAPLAQSFRERLSSSSVFSDPDQGRLPMVNRERLFRLPFLD